MDHQGEMQENERMRDTRRREEGFKENKWMRQWLSDMREKEKSKEQIMREEEVEGRRKKKDSEESS